MVTSVYFTVQGKDIEQYIVWSFLCSINLPGSNNHFQECGTVGEMYQDETVYTEVWS